MSSPPAPADTRSAPPPDGGFQAGPDDLSELASHVLHEIIDDLAEDRSGRAERDAQLRAALREFSTREFGNIDELAVEVARRIGLSYSHVRNCLFGRPSPVVLDAALEFYREHVAADVPPAAPRAAKAA